MSKISEKALLSRSSIFMTEYSLIINYSINYTFQDTHTVLGKFVS